MLLRTSLLCAEGDTNKEKLDKIMNDFTGHGTASASTNLPTLERHLRKTGRTDKAEIQSAHKSKGADCPIGLIHAEVIKYGVDNTLKDQGQAGTRDQAETRNEWEKVGGRTMFSDRDGARDGAPFANSSGLEVLKQDRSTRSHTKACVFGHEQQVTQTMRLIFGWAKNWRNRADRDEELGDEACARLQEMGLNASGTTAGSMV